MFQLNINLNEFSELIKLKKTEVKSKINDILKLGYDLMYPDTSKLSIQDKLIYSSLEELKSNQPQISDLNKSITQLLGITNNSSRKGEIVESFVEEYLKKKYSESSYVVKRSEGHCGDGWLSFSNKRKVIVEVKAYSKTVGIHEVEKLRNDMKYNQINLGIMVSLGTKIQNSKLIDLEIFSNNNKIYYIVKIGPVFESNDILDIGFDLLEKISNLDNNNFGKIILEDNLLLKTNLLLEKISSNQKLKASYHSMTFDIYHKMDSFNNEMSLLFLEQEQLVRQLLKEIEDNSMHNYNISEDGLKSIEKYKDYKCYLNLVKMLDVIKRNKLSYEIKKDKILTEKMDIKISQEKLTITLLNLNINLGITSKNNDIINNKKNMELIEKLLK